MNRFFYLLLRRQKKTLYFSHYIRDLIVYIALEFNFSFVLNVLGHLNKRLIKMFNGSNPSLLYFF